MILKWTNVVIFSFILIVNVSSKDDLSDLADFDFDAIDAQANSDEYAYYYNDEDNTMSHGLKKQQDEQQNHPMNGIESKQQKIKETLLRVWTNGDMKRKFAEVLPILKVMTSSQKLALAALISAQVSSEPGNELNINQVKEMFGNRQDLILPLTLDIANLVKIAGTSKTRPIEENESPPSQQLLRRSFHHDIEYIPSTSFLKDETLKIDEDDHKPKRVARDVSEQLKEIEHEMESAKTPEPEISKQTEEPKIDVKTQVENGDIVKQPQPIEQNDSMNENFQRVGRSIRPSSDRSYHERKLNMTAFNGTGDQLAMDSVQSYHYALPDETQNLNENNNNDDDVDGGDYLETYLRNNLTLQEIESLAFSKLNGTELENDDNKNSTYSDENLPTAEKLISIRYKTKYPQTNYRKRPSTQNSIPDMSNCERFGNVCIKTPEYPMEQIMGSIRRNRHAMTALLAEYRDAFIENNLDTDIMYIKRRGDNIQTPGGMCPSIVRYARPQKARSATGEWKYIVNTGQHTQTLRLEKCSAPQESCTYLTDSFKSRCTQVFNYHRLLSWDKLRGLHVDIFKVPTCCSCHVDGYRETFPPFYAPKPDISSEYKPSFGKIKTPKFSPTMLFYPESNEEDDEEETDLASFYSPDKYNFHTNSKPFDLDSSYLLQSASQKHHRYEKPKSSKNELPFIPSAPSIETYLSPPQNEYQDSVVQYKRVPSSSATHSSKRKRRPTKRRDQSVSESDIKVHKHARDHHIEITTIRPKKIYITPTPIVVESKKREKVNAKLQNVGTGSTSSSNSGSSSSSSIPSNHLLDSSKRVNYNYHPIIDFFEDEEDDDEEERELSEREIGDRIGLGVKMDRTKWRPMVHNQRRRTRNN